MNEQEQERLSEWVRDPEASLVSVSLDRGTCFMITSVLQLARRHPAFPHGVAIVIDQVIADFQSLMPEDIRQMSLRGSDPGHDVVIQRGEGS